MSAKIMLKLLGLAFAALFSLSTYASIDVYEFNSPQQEAQYRGLIDEFRCPKCQNQNLAGSDAPIAQDLKQKTYDMVQDGRSDGEIRVYMQDRYGDFISYKPPVRPSTWVLWFFPPLLLVLLIGGWFWQSRRRQKIARGQSGIATQGTATALTPKERSELERLLSGTDSTDHNVTHNTTGLEDEK